jgi:D-sedoheptulose 7-phosphate isomerase
MNYVRKYLAELQLTIDIVPVELVNEVIARLHEARLSQRRIFIMGNGGSAATASHFAADLAKNTRKDGWPNYRVMSLTDNTALLSAYANDEGYENVFVQQLASFVEPGDVVIGISCSGNSLNVLKAIDLANQAGALTIGMTGFDGGRLGELVHIHLHIPSRIIEQVEDIHLMVEHLVCKALREHPAEISQALQSGQNLAVPSETGDGHRKPSPELLYTLGRELETAGDGNERLQRTLQLSLESIGAASGSIILLNEDGEVADAALAYAGQVQAPQTLQLSELVREGLAGWVVENRQAALVANTLDDPRWLPRDWEQNIQTPRSVVCVPLLNGDRVVGVLTLAHSQAGQFNYDHLVHLTTIAVIVSLSGIRSLNFERL